VQWLVQKKSNCPPFTLTPPDGTLKEPCLIGISPTIVGGASVFFAARSLHDVISVAHHLEASIGHQMVERVVAESSLLSLRTTPSPSVAFHSASRQRCYGRPE
jgi:hypothetical protein